MPYTTKPMAFLLFILLAGLFLFGCAFQPLVNEIPNTSTPRVRTTETFTPTSVLDIASPTAIKIPSLTPISSEPPCPPEQPPKITLGGSYIGLQTPPGLDGLEFYDSLLIGTYENKELGVDHMFDGQNHFFLLDELICIDNEGHAHSKVIDEIQIPSLKDDEFVFAGMCGHSEMDNHIVVIGVFHDDWSITATMAWKVENEVFVELSEQELDGVECFDEHPDCVKR